MTEDKNDLTAGQEGAIQSLVARAVGGAFEDWARLHPSLAAVIDRVELTSRISLSIRQNPSYKEAIAAFHRSQNELELLDRLISLAGPAILKFLGV